MSKGTKRTGARKEDEQDNNLTDQNPGNAGEQEHAPHEEQQVCSTNVVCQSVTNGLDMDTVTLTYENVDAPFILIGTLKTPVGSNAMQEGKVYKVTITEV